MVKPLLKYLMELESSIRVTISQFQLDSTEHTDKEGVEGGGRNIQNLTYTDDTTLRVENSNNLKQLVMKIKEENAKAKSHLNIETK